MHIHDLVDLYLLVLDKALVARATGINDGQKIDPFERWYFGSAGEFAWGDAARGLAPLLHARGLVNSPEAVSVPPDEVSPAVATNSRSVSNRGFKDGWKPSRPGLQDTLEEDIEGVLEVDGLKK